MESMWRRRDATDWLLIFLFIAGLFLFPLAILKVAMMEDVIELLDLRRFFVPVIKVFIPCSIVVAILAAACFIDTITKQYSPMAKESALTVTGNLFMNLAGQVVAIIAMRSVGLLYRHFGCYFGY